MECCRRFVKVLDREAIFNNLFTRRLPNEIFMSSTYFWNQNTLPYSLCFQPKADRRKLHPQCLPRRIPLSSGAHSAHTQLTGSITRNWPKSTYTQRILLYYKYCKTSTQPTSLVMVFVQLNFTLLKKDNYANHERKWKKRNTFY